MKRLLTVGLLAGLLAFAAAKPASAGAHVSVGIGFPGFGAVFSNGPVYAPYPYYSYYPAPYAYPAYYGPPAIYAAPLYYPRYYSHWHGHSGHYYRPYRRWR